MSRTVTEQDEQLQADSEQVVRCLLIPQKNATLLLPGAVIAEVTDYTPPETSQFSPDWLLGILSWRGRNIPLVEFENLFGAVSIQEEIPNQVAVLNCLNGNQDISFIAITLNSLPHLVQVDSASIEYVEEDLQEDESGAILARMNFSGEAVVVPNIDFIEERIRQLGI